MAGTISQDHAQPKLIRTIRRPGMQVSWIEHAKFTGLHGKGLYVVVQAFRFQLTCFPVPIGCSILAHSHEPSHIHALIVYELNGPHFRRNIREGKPGGNRMKVI